VGDVNPCYLLLSHQESYGTQQMSPNLPFLTKQACPCATPHPPRLTWWALDEREGFSQSVQNSLVLTLVELPLAAREIKGFLLQDFGRYHC